jgi:hypothetical protein
MKQDTKELLITKMRKNRVSIGITAFLAAHLPTKVDLEDRAKGGDVGQRPIRSAFLSSLGFSFSF